MKKTLIAGLASLMLAGVLCAVDGAPLPTPKSAAVLGDGLAPVPLTLPASLAVDTDTSSSQ